MMGHRSKGELQQEGLQQGRLQQGGLQQAVTTEIVPQRLCKMSAWYFLGVLHFQTGDLKTQSTVHTSSNYTIPTPTKPHLLRIPFPTPAMTSELTIKSSSDV